MKKKTLAILFLGFMGLKSVANPVSPEEARQVAERFFRNLGAEDGTSMDVRRSPVALPKFPTGRFALLHLRTSFRSGIRGGFG